MRKKEVTLSGMVVTRTLFLNLKPFCVLFDSAIHLFISTLLFINMFLLWLLSMTSLATWF